RQLAGEGGEGGPGRQGAGQVRPLQGEFLEGHIVQPGAGGGALQPQGYRREKVEPGAKARFHQGEAAVGGEGLPAGRQIVALDEHVAALREAVLPGVVDVAKGGGQGLAVRPCQGGGGERGGGLVHRARPNSARTCPHQRASRSSLRWNSFSSSRARPTKWRPSALRAREPSKR